jgi:putative methyltransferase (TIGR04325 family)
MTQAAQAHGQLQRLQLPSLRELPARLKSVQPILSWRKRRYERLFASTSRWRGLHRGLYRSFAEARRHAPPALSTEYSLDHESFARQARIESFDYPAMLWLARALPTARSLFDLGGHVGLHFFAYRRYLQYPAGLRWIVCERPEVVSLGQNMCRTRDAAGLSFVTDWAEADGSDVLLSSGCVQFLEERLWRSMAALAQPPTHVILNKLPLYDLDSCVTLQNTGRSFSPCWLLNRLELLREFAQLGYRLVDEWSCPGRALEIPFHAEHSVPEFSGLYLRRELG